MKTKTVFVFLSSVLLLCALTIFELHAQQSPSKNTPPASSWKAVDEAMGRAGQDQPDGTHKFAMPRSDMKVTLDGVGLKANDALVSGRENHLRSKETRVRGGEDLLRSGEMCRHCGNDPLDNENDCLDGR